MRNRTMTGRLVRGTVVFAVCLFVLAGCGGKDKGNNNNGGNANNNGNAPANPAAGGALTLSADAALLFGDDATGKAIHDLKGLESTGEAGKGIATGEALLKKIPENDARRAEVGGILQRFKNASAPSEDLVAAVLALGSKDEDARKVGRDKIKSAGEVGQFHLRNVFWTSKNPQILFEAARLFRESADHRAYPLMIARFRMDPDDPLRYEMVRGLEKIIGLHSGSKLGAADLMELLIVAEEAGDTITRQMLRALASAWDPGQLDASVVKKLCPLLSEDPGFDRRHIASFLGIVYTASCDSDASKFGSLAGSGSLSKLQKYVGDSLLVKDQTVKSWGGYASPMLGMVDLQALKKGLLLYFDFNEEIMKNGKYFTCLRDQSREVTRKSPRGWLKGVLAEQGSRVAGVRGNGIKFGPKSMIEFPSNREFRQVMKDSYSYAIWIRPEATPTIGPMTPYIPPSKDVDETPAAFAKRRRATRIRWEKEKAEPAYGLLIGKMGAGGSGMKGGLGLRFNGNRQIKFVHYPSGARPGSITSTTTLPLNKWAHVAATVDVDGGVMNLYVNGKLEASRKFAPGTPGHASTTNQFGAIGGALRDGSRKAHFFTGIIDEARVYSRAITAAEAKALHDAFLPE